MCAIVELRKEFEEERGAVATAQDAQGNVVRKVNELHHKALSKEVNWTSFIETFVGDELDEGADGRVVEETTQA